MYSVNIPKLPEVNNAEATIVDSAMSGETIEQHSQLNKRDVTAASNQVLSRIFQKTTDHVTETEVADAMIRSHAVTAQHVNATYPTADAPAWFQAFQQQHQQQMQQTQHQIEQTQHQMQQMQHQMQQMQHQMQQIQHQMIHRFDQLTQLTSIESSRNISRAYNAAISQEDAAIQALVNDDGALPHPFPRDTHDVRALPSLQVNALLTGYGQPVEGNVNERRKRFSRFIGLNRYW